MGGEEEEQEGGGVPGGGGAQEGGGVQGGIGVQVCLGIVSDLLESVVQRGEEEVQQGEVEGQWGEEVQWEEEVQHGEVEGREGGVEGEWMEGIQEEAQELLAMFGLPLAGEHLAPLPLAAEHPVTLPLSFPCTSCDKVFKTAKFLYYHERKQHTEPSVCGLCNREFSSKVKLQYHTQKVHCFGPAQLPRVLMCDLCPKMFTSNSNFSQHRKTHHDKKPKLKVERQYSCSECNKLFRRRWNLKRHKLAKHSKQGSRPQPTGAHKLCHSHRTHLQRSSARRPLRTHRRRKPLKHHQQPQITFPCHLCPKKLPTKQSLWNHRYQVHSKRSFRCTMCDKTFKVRSHLVRHKIEVHEGPGRRRKEVGQLCRARQLDRLKKEVEKFNENMKKYSEPDKKKMLKMLIKKNPNLLEAYKENPLSEADVIDMVQSNLSDRQALAICTIIRRRFGRQAVTANIKKILRERKTMLSHIFTSELLDKEDQVHFVDKKGNPVTRHLVYCTDLVALTEAKNLLEEEEEYENVIGVDDGKGLLKVMLNLLFVWQNFQTKRLICRSHGRA